MEKYNRVKRELVHKGTIINMYKDYIEVPNGNHVEWDFIGHNGAAAVIPITDDGKILLVKQWRNALDRFTIELPAGGLENIDEPMIECAARELEEETGYIGVWGQRRLNYLKYHRKVLYYNLLTSGKLHSHLTDTEKQAQQLFSRLVKQYAEKENVTKEPKATDMILWGAEDE